MSLIHLALQNQQSQSCAHPIACVHYALNQFLSSHFMSAVASTFPAVLYKRSRAAIGTASAPSWQVALAPTVHFLLLLELLALWSHCPQCKC